MIGCSNAILRSCRIERGGAGACRVEHPPWQFQPAAAQVSAGDLGRPFRLDLHRAADRVQYSEGVTARVGAFELVK